MRPIFRHSLVGSLVVMPVLAVIAATVSARSAVPRLLAQEVEEGAAKVSPFVQREFAVKKTPAQSAEVEKRAWLQATRQMQAEGATEKEAHDIQGALEAASNQAGNVALPVHVRSASVWGRRVWAITLGWECRKSVEQGGARPCHRWTVVIETDAPHHVLEEDRCG